MENDVLGLSLALSSKNPVKRLHVISFLVHLFSSLQKSTKFPCKRYKIAYEQKKSSEDAMHTFFCVLLVHGNKCRKKKSIRIQMR